MRSASAMRAGLDEATIQKMHAYEASDLTERQKMALRLADALADDPRGVDAALVARLRTVFGEDELVDLGMTIAFFFGWGRFIEAFDILPEGLPADARPWEPEA